MSGQFGFQPTDHLPLMSGPTFAAEDIDDLGLEMCLTVWRRMQIPGRLIALSEYRDSLKTGRWFEFWRSK